MGKISGVLFFIAGFVIFMGITTAEIFYPGYNVATNFISTLGSSPPPNSVVLQPSASIFDTAMIIAGALIIAGAIVLLKINKDKLFETALIFMGIGSLGVGLCPAYTGMIHLTFAFTAFLAGGFAAIISFRDTKAPFRYVGVILGITTITFLIVGKFAPQLIVPILERGGVERWVAYPIMIWVIGLGGYLMNSNGLIKDKR